MAAMSDPLQGNRQFAFLLVDKFSMFSLAAAIDCFRSANRLLGRDFYGWKTVSADGDPLSRLGMPVLSCQDIGMPAPPRKKKKKPAMSLMAQVTSRPTPTRIIHDAGRKTTP